MENKKIADGVLVFSAVAALISGYVNLTQNNLFNLAGTQWLLIAIVLGIYAVYARIRTA